MPGWDCISSRVRSARPAGLRSAFTHSRLIRNPIVRNRLYSRAISSGDQETRKGNRMDILLIGGLWLDGSAWDTVAAELGARGHRAVPVTLPGQGDGNAPAT